MAWTDTKLGLLWRLEMRHLLRDRRALVAAFLLPLLALPVVLWTARLLERAGRQQVAEEALRVSFDGAAAQWVRRQLLDAGAVDETLSMAGASESPQAVQADVGDPDHGAAVRSIAAPGGAAPDPWRPVQVEEPFLALARGEVDLVVQGRWLGDPPPAPGATSTDSPPPDGVALQLFFRADYGRSNRALDVLRGQLSAARAEMRRSLLREKGLDLENEPILPLIEHDMASRGQVAGSQLGRWLTVAILLFVVLGGSVVAGDTLAGERERGTLETLLTCAVDRRQIAVAKLLAILAFGALVAGVQLLNLFVQLTWVMEEPPSHFAVELTWSRLVLLAVLFLPLLATTAGALLWVSGRAQSYREFHFYLLPLAVGLLLPTTAAALPGVSLASGWVLLPLANLSLAIRAVLAGHFVWYSVLIAWLVTAAVAVWVVKATMADVMSETQLTGSQQRRDDMPLQPFERHVGIWFAGFWCFMFLALVHLPLLSGFIPQLLLNLVLVCLGGSWLLIRLYGLEPRQTLALRSPAVSIWPLVGVGAPALAIVNGAIYQWTTKLFPLSRQALESLTSGLDTTRLSSLEILALVAVLPAICEEIAFRGVLLEGLRRRMPETQLCLVSGAIFALFHFDLARALPTLILGAVLALLTLRSGSIYPAMLWHGLNNALALWSSRHLTSTLHPEVYGAAALAVIWLLRRLRRQPKRLRMAASDATASDATSAVAGLRER